jgi:hypothetical protein
MTVTKTNIAEKATARLAEVGAPPEQEELKELPSLFATVLSDDVDAALHALSRVGYHLLASDTVDPLSGPLLEPLCAAASHAHPVVQVEIWRDLAYVAGRMADAASRDAHEVFRPYAIARIAEQVLRERPGAPAVCSLAALAVAYPDWGRLAVPRLAAAFGAAKPLTTVRTLTALGLLGLGVMHDNVITHLHDVMQADTGGDVARALEYALRPASRMEPSLHWRLGDYWIQSAMHTCVHGYWTKITNDTLVPFD